MAEKTKIKTETIDPEKAKAILQAENEQRAEKCKGEIEKILKDNKCEMQVGIFITANGNIPQINIIPKN